VVNRPTPGDGGMTDELPRLRKKEKQRPSLASAFGENLTLTP
jgi:hypothetical protein